MSSITVAIDVITIHMVALMRTSKIRSAKRDVFLKGFATRSETVYLQSLGNNSAHPTQASKQAHNYSSQCRCLHSLFEKEDSFSRIFQPDILVRLCHASTLCLT